LGGLADLLKHGDVPTKLQALKALGNLAQTAKSKIPNIVSAVGDEDPTVAATACITLATMSDKIHPGEAATAAVKALAENPRANELLRKIAQESHDVLTGKKPLKPPEKAAKLGR